MCQSPPAIALALLLDVRDRPFHIMLERNELFGDYDATGDSRDEDGRPFREREPRRTWKRGGGDQRPEGRPMRRGRTILSEKQSGTDEEAELLVRVRLSLGVKGGGLLRLFFRGFSLRHSGYVHLSQEAELFSEYL